jgi:hypothetical protein
MMATSLPGGLQQNGPFVVMPNPMGGAAMMQIPNMASIPSISTNRPLNHSSASQDKKK